MTPITPHIITALYTWITHNDMTPYLLVNTEVDDVAVPVHLINDNKIILNINPTAIEDFFIDDDGISFHTRFSGSRVDIYLPTNSIISIYAKETGQGMIFSPEGNAMEQPTPPPEPPTPAKKPKLKIIK